MNAATTIVTEKTSAPPNSVSIRCQIYAFDKNGNRAGLYDKVGDYYVPDKYMRTRFTGRIPSSPPGSLSRW